MKKSTRVARRRRANDEPTNGDSTATPKATEEAAAEPSTPKRVQPTRPKLERSLSELHTDLQAIADMDMTELDALMAGTQPSKRYDAGDPVSGTITALSGQFAFVALGLKSEATIDIAELNEPKIGDIVEAFVMQTEGGTVHLSKRLTGEAASTALQAAIDEDLPVEGKVVGRNTGGFEVLIGSIRAFCPVSQMSRYHTDNGEQFMGQTYQFHVLEGGDNVVLSRRAFEEEQAAKRAASFWLDVTVGDTHQGIVRSVKDFGVFVDISGAEGLVPHRELSWDAGHIDLEVGQTLEVRVIQLDRETKRLTLSAKDPGLSPWNQVGTKFVRGKTYSGHVVKLTDFGAFIELAPGLQGLLHLSQMGGNVPAVGDVVEVDIQQIDHERNRLSLRIATEHDDSEIGTEVRGTIQDVIRPGIAVTLDDGRAAWLAVDDANLPASTTLAQRFRRGRSITARVKQFDAQRNRVVLSQKDTLEDDAWRADLKTQQTGSFGTFAELLKGIKLD